MVQSACSEMPVGTSLRLAGMHGAVEQWRSACGLTPLLVISPADAVQLAISMQVRPRGLHVCMQA